MSDPPPQGITQALEAVSAGEEQAAHRLLPLVYDELRRLAAARMARTPPGQTLQATALVHEAYLRVAGDRDAAWSGRGHFFFAAARAMRDILVESARSKATVKRGGGYQRIEYGAGCLVIEDAAVDLPNLDDAISKLEAEDPEKARIVMLRFFAGLTVEETAGVLGVSVSTVERQWRFTRAWLRRELDLRNPPDRRASS